MTEETMMQQNEVIPAVIAIADLCQPEGQRRFHIDDVFEDYQERVEERVHLEAERLAKATSVHTWGQTARDEGQDHAPGDTEGDTARGGTHSAGGGSGSAIKGKGKQWATSEEDELANDKGNGQGKLSPSTKGLCVTGDDEPCKTCAQANLVCIREPEASCKWCRKAKCKCLCSRGIGRKRKNSGTAGEAGLSHKWVKSIMTSKAAPAEPATGPAKKLTLKIPAHKWQPDPTPTCSPLPQPTPSPHDPLPTPHFFFCGATPTPGPSTLPDPVNKPCPTLPFDEPQIEFKPFSMIATGLLNELGGTKEPVWDDTPSGAEILEARAEDKEFKLEQIYWLLEMLVRQVTHQIETACARQEELQRLKDNLWDL
ncbi:hypothetical protein M404DRAFT_29139 [Pisolithus tinctorius Marx 270]|uniref:Uncharacterized protein n=1 Tax=Pisolithus tinctorius Marx 270 TaxID=870435 RepID=A0A0C3P0A7_PISTI|nr:hypothetical protein M404DRAFT_29139 [Pisolithus tinctorius Marx 270]